MVMRGKQNILHRRIVPLLKAITTKVIRLSKHLLKLTKLIFKKLKTKKIILHCTLTARAAARLVSSLVSGVILPILKLCHVQFAKLLVMIGVLLAKIYAHTLSPVRKRLVARYRILQKWDKWKYRVQTRNATSVLAIIIVIALVIHPALMAIPDLNDTWDFNNPGDYNASSGIEIASGIARLKAQNYTSDANTSALYHLDESGGTNVTDSSSNGNDGTLNGGSFTTGNLNNALSLNGDNDHASANDSASLKLGQTQTIEAWTKFGSAFNSTSHDRRSGVVDKGDYQLYYNNETGKLTYEIANANATNWTQVAGSEKNGSWDLDGKITIESMSSFAGNTYVGTGNSTGDAEVWKWDGSSWAMLGGDGRNNGWQDDSYENTVSMANDGTNLYVGFGATAGDGDVWKWDGSSWTKIGGDSLNSGWTAATYEYAYSLNFFGGNLYAGLGSSANDAEVWRWNGSSWTKIGGDSLNSGWTTNFEIVPSLTNDGTNLYAGLGNSAGDAEVWRWNGSSWSRIGGDAINSSWANSTYENVLSMTFYGSNLYVGLGTSANDAEVWRWNGSSWSQIGGDSLNSGWTTNYEGVYSLTNDGTNLYAGLGNSAGDNEVWQWNGTSWAKIGGDGVNSSFGATHTTVNALVYSDGSLKAGLNSGSGIDSGHAWEWNGTSWTRIGGDYVNKSWGFRGLQSVEVMQVSGEYLYAGTGVSYAGNAQVWRWNGSTWEMIGGQGINGSWSYATYETVTSMASMGGDLYVGLGTSANDAEVWRWNGSSWSQIGGDSLNSGWTTGFEEVNSLAAFGGSLYAGLGNSASDAEVWRWNGSSWSRIGGDNTNGGWPNGYYRISSLGVYKNKLIAGLGYANGQAEVWEWNGSNWSKIGGDTVNTSWPASGYEQIDAITVYGNDLIVSLGYNAGDAEVWKYDGTNWAKIGGDDINNSWTDGTYERSRTLTVYNGNLIAGLGNTAGESEVWSFDGTIWSKIGGNGVNSSWSSAVEEVTSFSPYKGKLYAGLGNSANIDSSVWAFGDNGFLESSTNSFDTNWHHVAATYDGSTMKLFVDGTQNGTTPKTFSVSTSDKKLYIGASYGGREYGKPSGRFSGQLDEIRLSNVARSSFTTTPYATTAQTIQPTQAARKSGVWHWDTLSHTDIPNGGSITYRISDNNGTTWKYWDGLTWANSNTLSESNTTTVITSHFDTFPVTYDGVLWQAVMTGNGQQQVSLDGVSAEATSDTIDPSTNPTNITAYKANGGSAFSSGAWTNGSSPYFTWDAGNDAESGINGYCAYLGTDSNGDPVSTKGQLGASPTATGDNCQFVINDTNLDLAQPGILSVPLSSSNDMIYLNLRSIDKAGNVANSSAQFQFKFDNTPPSNPGYITAPSGFINTKDVTMSWPTSGGSAPNDANSGLAGLQYRIGSSGTWYGDAHNGSGDISDILTNDGTYTTVPTPDYTDLAEGINTIYFRTWDQAGNYTTTYATATLKINTSGAPSEPQNLVASPTTNTVNSFGFNWDSPSTYVGDVNNITYCYTVNVVPSASSCAYTAPGSTELTVGPYATQPGNNTLYVVARDESSNINYTNYASVVFTANTSAPGVPLNTDIVDVSIKNTSKWRLALTWTEPTYTGSGISSYRIYRSTNNITFNQVGSSSSTTYIDGNLTQQTYYYKVTACDNTNNCGAGGAVVNAYPTGKFTSPATITSGPSVSNITTKKATISWSTDRSSDSKISIGTQSGHYSSAEVGNSSQVSAHEISLDNLSPGTTYYFKAKWTDEDGNTGSSQEQTFTTAPAPLVKEISIDSINLSGTSISFTTRGAKSAKLYYGASEAFGGLKEVNTSFDESRYQINIDQLNDGTKYYFMVSTVDQEGAEYSGNIMTFTTPSRPRITNLRFQPVTGESTSTQKVTWDTNVPTTSQVSYSTANGQPIELQDSKMVTSHEVIIHDLEDDSTYSLIAQSRDASGNLATSDKQLFKTALDTRPPKTSSVVVESSIRGSGSEARGQIVVSWHTDEPATSQVAYSEGSGVTVFNNKSAQDTRLTTEHIVIISDLPTSRVYSIQPLSQDSAKNEGQGETQTAIIGRSSDNAITIIFNTLKSIFGI
ncbi:MAG: LamG domain-containing protein [Candidatus Saccharimonadales bacterium]